MPVTVSGQHSTRVRRYRAITGASMPAEVLAALDDDRQLVRESARVQVSGPLAIEDVVEATSQLPAPGVEALLAARQQGFQLDARTLVQLEQARVPTSVIDVMVALSYPGAFAVEDPNEAPELPAEMLNRTPRTWSVDDCDDWRYRRRYGDPRYGYGYGNSNCYNGYGWNSRYGSWNDPYYGWRGGNGPVVVIVRPGDGEDVQPRTPGQVVKGRGYTRGSSNSGSGSAQPRSTTGSSTSGGSRAQPATSTGSTSSGGSSSSGSSTGRTAKPRTGGGS